MSIADRIREGRKITVEVDGKKFTGTRATFEQFAEYVQDRTTNAQVARNHITGWDGITEADLIESGSSKEAVNFSRELFAEAIADNIDWQVKIADAILADAMKRAQLKADNEKK